MRDLITLLTTFIVLFTSARSAAGQHILFKNITTDNGLSQVSVNCLYVDENGIIWIGTRDGLNRYDGLNVQTFKLRKGDPNSLFCNTILALAGNGQGAIYLLCNDGVVVFDLRMERFKTIYHGRVNSIYHKDRLYIGVKNQIFRYDSENDLFIPYRQLPRSDDEVSCLHETKQTMWIGTTGNGVYRMEMESGEIVHPILKGNITSIYEDRDGELWIGSWEDGLHHILQNGKIETLSQSSGLSSDFVRACCEDNIGNIWIGTSRGLDRYNKSTKHVMTYSPDRGNSSGMTHYSVWCIVRDMQGSMWLGTYFGGVNYFNPEYEIFNLFQVSETEEDGLSHPIVGKIIEAKNESIWICTEGGGLNHYDMINRRFKWYCSESTPNTLSHNHVKSLYYDETVDVLWIGTHTGGLNKLDLSTGQIEHFRRKPGDSSTLPSDIIRDITKYKDRLVIGTQNGVCLFDPSDGQCTQMFNDSYEGLKIKMVASVLVDRSGLLWVAGTGEGVYCYDFENGFLTNYRHDPKDEGSLSNNNVNSIMEDSAGNLWFATSGCGLDVLRPGCSHFENFDMEKNGLISDCVYDVQESFVSGNLVLSTSLGLSIFDPENGTFRNFGIGNGFPLTAVSENSLCVTRDGDIFLGGMKGMISFKEKDLDFPAQPFRILLTDLYVNGKEVRPSDGSGILDKSLAYTGEIILHPKESAFNIKFAVTNYVEEKKSDFVYRLEGFSKEWTSTRGNHIITYTNLKPGTYRLVIKAENVDETLCSPVTLKIKVLAPFYLSPLAFLIYLFLIGSIAFYIVRTYNARIQLHESLKYEQQHTKDVEALNQAKLRFFTNISHEFRTPLTMIVAQSEELIKVQNFTPVMYNKLLSIYQSSVQLNELITELLDFRKQEQGHMKIKVGPHDLILFIYENYLLFKNYASLKGIVLTFEKNVDALEVWYDQKQMQKVINNLLSNASKHTKEGGTIALGVFLHQESAVIQVKDTGSGIDPKDIDTIFERFYHVRQDDSSEGVTGIGIGLALTKGIVELHHGSISVDSKLGEGSCFTVRLPLGRDAFAADEISEGPDTEMKADNLSLDRSVLPDPEKGGVARKGKIPCVKMLIVEDNPVIREMLVEIFRPYYLVFSAADGQEGQEMVAKRMPDIVVSDIVMPRMSGIELCKSIKKDFDTCHIPVVLLTAKGCLEQSIEGFRIGADDYISKPFNVSLLISRCNNLINSRMLLQEKFTRQPAAHVRMLATNPMDKALLDRATKIIEEHLEDTEFNVITFSREMAMARTKLFSKLKAVTGQTPNDFIRTIRIKKGAAMLRNNPELNVTEISERIGFSSSRYFSKCFKQCYNMSPRAWRNGTDVSVNAGMDTE